MVDLNGARAAHGAKGPWRGPAGKLVKGEDPGPKLTVEPSQCHLVKEIHIYFHIKNIIAKEKVILQRT